VAVAARSLVAVRSLVAARSQAVAHSLAVARIRAAADSRAAAVDNPGSTCGPTAPDAIPAGKTRRRPATKPPSAKKKPARSDGRPRCPLS